MRSANASPSASAMRFNPRIRLTASLARPPSPTLPMWKRRGNNASSTALASSAVVGSPPIRPTPSPCRTCSLVPDTGVSRKRILPPASRAPSASIRSGSQVRVHITMVPSPAAGSSPFSTTSSTWSVLNTASRMVLQAATSASEPALPPRDTSRAFFAGSMSVPTTPKPAAISRPDSTSPISPRPTSPDRFLHTRTCPEPVAMPS